MVNRRTLFAAAGLPWLIGADAAEAMTKSGSGQPHGIAGPLLPKGACADGASHPLSTCFHDLDAARAIYPQARSLSDELDWCAVQAAIDAADAQGGGAVYVPNTGRSYCMNRGLVINPNRVTMRGDGAALDFRTLHGQSAILFKSDGAAAYGHERHVFEGFELIGPGRNGAAVGLLFRTDTEGLSSRAQIQDCTIHDFSRGVQFGNRAYGIGFSHVSIFECMFCVDAPAGLTDAGETTSFSQCYLFNSDCLIANAGAFELKFLACSLDYGRRVILDNNGGIDLVGCHVEIPPPTDPPFHNAGGRLNMFGGFFLVNGSREAVHAAEMFALTDPMASVHLFGVMGWNWRTTTGRLTNGPGRIHWYEGAEINAAPPGIRHP